MKYFSGGSVVKNLPANAGGATSIPGLERSTGVRNDNPLQFSSWRIPEKAGRLQSIRSQRDEHNGVTEHTHTRSCETKAIEKDGNVKSKTFISRLCSCVRTNTWKYTQSM